MYLSPCKFSEFICGCFRFKRNYGKYKKLWFFFIPRKSKSPEYHHPFFIPHRMSVFICICSWVLINARMVQLKGVERISRISHQQAAEMLHLSSQMEAHEWWTRPNSPPEFNHKHDISCTYNIYVESISH